MSFLWEKSDTWRWIVRRTGDSKPFFVAFATICSVVPGVIGYAVMQLISSRNKQLEAHLHKTSRPETLVVDLQYVQTVLDAVRKHCKSISHQSIISYDAICFLILRLLQNGVLTRDSTTLLLYSLRQGKSPPSLFFKSFSTLSSDTRPQEEPSITVAYLTDSCGLSLQSALSVFKKVNFKTTKHNADSVIELFRTNGFSNTHISRLIFQCPELISYHPKRTLKPKIDFFTDLGFSGPALGSLLVANSRLVTMSLKNKIIPAVHFLKALVHTDENVIRVLKRAPWILTSGLQTAVPTNLSILRNQGIPESNLFKLIIRYPTTLSKDPDQFAQTVATIRKMGFDPLCVNFVVAVAVMIGLDQSNWERKVDVYKSWDWSQDEVLSAFRLHPICMAISEKKIRRAISFFVNVLGFKRMFLSRYPIVLLYSMDKRIAPRCTVLQILLSKGLVKSSLSIPSVLLLSEERFLDKFVIKFQERVPEVVKAYEEVRFVGEGKKIQL